MPQLKIETKITHAIGYSDWDRFVQKSFPNCPYEGVACEEEMSNDSTWTCEVDGAMNEEGLKKIETYLLEGEESFIGFLGTRHILNYLAYKKVLPTGHYSIRISW